MWRLLVLAALARACETDLDCSLNGACAAGACACDDGWRGGACELLDLAPAPLAPAYGAAPNVSSWGAHVVRGGDGLYHMFVSEMWNGCGISSWRNNSHVVRAVAADFVGPFRYDATVLGPFATCAHAAALGGGALALFHQGDGAERDALRTCGGGPPNPPEVWPPPDAPASARAAAHVSASGAPGGPWAPLAGAPPCDNPSPWTLDNGTTVLACHGPGVSLTASDDPLGGGGGGGAAWSAPRYAIAPGPRPWPGRENGSQLLVWEDPHLWVDRRGAWHMLAHVYPVPKADDDAAAAADDAAPLPYNAIVAGHAFSADGVAWTLADAPPYDATVTRADGSVLTYGTRERPFLLLSDDGARRPLALYTAVTRPGTDKTVAGEDASFTLVQPVAPWPGGGS